MMQHEFEARIEGALSPAEWDVISRIYAFSPELPDVGGKDTLARIFRERGFEMTAHLLLGAANAAAETQGAAPVYRQIETWSGIEIVDDEGVVRETRPKTVQQVYAYCRDRLGTLVDDYFSLADGTVLTAPWPTVWRRIKIFPVTGGSEGHYVHVEVETLDGTTRLMFLAKTFQGMTHAWQIARQLGDALHI
jgi:hypothetical protein